MNRLTPGDLLGLEAYAKARAEFRARVMAHKKNRRVAIGPNASLYFEDRLTIQYQVQEMLRIERLFESQEIADELAAYNPLIPDGTNWKATYMIEYPDVDQRRARLRDLKGIERQTWVQVEGFAKRFPIANEDLDRENGEKTSSVHFLRFELDGAEIAALKAGAAVAMGSDHGAYPHRVEALAPAVRDALVADLD